MIDSLHAFIFGAGYGVRLLPLTETRPKVTVPVMGKPIIFYALERLTSSGITSFVINTHYKADYLQTTVGSGNKWGVSISYSHEPEILETGGGLKNAEPLITSGTFIVYNGDILCDVNINDALLFHRKKEALATLVVASWCSPRQLNLDSDNRIVDIRHSRKCAGDPTHTFLGIHIIEREIFSYMKTGKYSIIETYLKLIDRGLPIYAYEMPQGSWYDIGSISQYKNAHREFMKSQRIHTGNSLCLLHKPASSAIHNTVEMSGYVSLGERNVVEENVTLSDVILWDDVIIKKNTKLENVIIRDGAIVSGLHKDEIL